MQIDTSKHAKAALAIQYRSDIQTLINELQHYFPEYELLLLDSLESNPQISAEALKEKIFEAHDEDYSIYDNQRFNEALLEISRLGSEAKQEMREALDVLGDTADIDVITKKLVGKYGKLSVQSQASLPPESISPLADRNDSLHNRDYGAALQGINSDNHENSSQTAKSKPNTESDIQNAARRLLEKYGERHLTDLMTKFGIKRQYVGPKSGYHYFWNGKRYDSLEDAVIEADHETTLQDAAFSDTDAIDENQLSDTKSEIDKAVSNIKIAFWAGIISLVITIGFFIYSTQNPRSTLGNLYDEFTLLEIGLVAVLVWGIHLKSRTAAVLMFVLFLLNKFFMFSEFRVNGGVILQTLAFGTAYFLGIVGTFKYHSEQKKSQS